VEDGTRLSRGPSIARARCEAAHDLRTDYISLRNIDRVQFAIRACMECRIGIADRRTRLLRVNRRPGIVVVTWMKQQIDGLERNWHYEREPLELRCYTRYFRRFLGARPAPSFAELKPVTPRNRWLVYFIFAPNGRLEPFHHYSLNQLRRHDSGLLVVVAGPSSADVPQTVLDCADAVFWKALNGYDFSAYGIALREIAKGSAGADVLVMNDSVFGPLTDLTPFIDNAPWELTGFTATNVSEQKHIQSYAFIMKNVTPERLLALRWIFPSAFAFNTASQTISCQELWFARAASRSMSVGAFWYGAEDVAHDPSLSRADALVRAGFPFLKRSLLGKHKRFQSTPEIQRLVDELGCDVAPKAASP
jgi:hypothetical protein